MNFMTANDMTYISKTDNYGFFVNIAECATVWDT